MKRFPNTAALLYLVYTLPLLIALALATPPWQNPDEPLHMARAVQIAHGSLFGSRAWGTAGGPSDAAIYLAYKPVEHAAMHPAERVARSDLKAANAVRWSPQVQYTSFPNTVQYAPVFYLPAAVAYWVGRAGGLPIDATLLLARLANAAIFAAATTLALALASRTRWLLAATLLLPTTLSLACAASHDGLIIAATALAVAMLDRMIAGHRAATRPETIIVAALLVSVAAARPPYAGFLLALLLLKPRPDRPLLALLAFCAAIVLAWCAAVALWVTVPLGGANIGRQLQYLSTHADRIAPIILHTLRRSSWEYVRETIGVLGWNDTPLPTPYILAQIVVLAIAAAATAGVTRLRTAPLMAVAFSILSIFILQWLTWTWPGQGEITGVFGRYFIPATIMLALALPARLWRSFAVLAPAAIFAVALVTPAVMLHAEIVRYYLK